MRGDEFFLKIASKPPLSKLHPAVAAFFKDYLSGEKATRFGDRYVVNTHMPPYPGRAFDCMMEPVCTRRAGRRLFSVTSPGTIPSCFALISLMAARSIGSLGSARRCRLRHSGAHVDQHLGEKLLAVRAQLPP